MQVLTSCTPLAQVKYAGEVEVSTRQAPELVRTEERIVEVTQPCHPCALIKNGLDLDRMSRSEGGYTAGAHGLMASGHQYYSQVYQGLEDPGIAAVSCGNQASA